MLFICLYNSFMDFDLHDLFILAYTLMKNLRIKLKIHHALVMELESQVTGYQRMLASIKVSKNADTKSSAGDKFETGREMMQMEMDKTEMQINKANYALEILNQLENSESSKTIRLGSLVHCDTGTYYVSIGHGSISVDGVKYYAISLKSPIGERLFDRKVGDKITFNDRIINIIDIC